MAHKVESESVSAIDPKGRDAWSLRRRHGV